MKKNRVDTTANISLGILVGTLLLAVFLAAVMANRTEQALIDRLERIGAERLTLYASTVEAAHSRFDYLPFIVAEDDQVRSLLLAPTSDSLRETVNRKIESWRRESNADVLYLMDADGIVVASSNWDGPDSFVGHDYHFRPYFIDAAEGRLGRFFAVGVTTGRPGLFLSRPVTANGQLLGVAVLKIDMAPLEQDWAAGGENVWVSDRDGVIFLASNPDWHYHSLEPLSTETQSRLQSIRKYHLHPIAPLQQSQLAVSPSGNPLIRLEYPAGESADYLLHQRDIPELEWRLYYLSDLSGLSQSRVYAIVMAALIAAVLGLLTLFLTGRLRLQQQLERRVARRTRELNQINTHLQQEVEDRRRAEQALHQTHEELVQAEKLAALGQLSAGLVHEISQPVSAIQTYLASTQVLAERGEQAQTRANLSEIDGLIRRVSAIVTHLKTFASKSHGDIREIPLNSVIEHALLVVGPGLKKDNVTLAWDPPSPSPLVKADEIKLEQVLINLLRNAIDATQLSREARPAQIAIRLSHFAGQVCIVISDNGVGIDAADLPRVFEPFFTSKAPGKGMGLGLSVSLGIVEDLGGQLTASPNADHGTSFQLTLPATDSAHD